MRLKSFISLASTIAMSLSAITVALPGSSIAAQSTTPTPIPACPGAPAAHLSVGAYVRVVPGLTAYIRKDPNKTADKVAQVTSDDRLFTTGGPTCADSFLWWPVSAEVAGASGWVAEGAGATYYLLPAYAGHNFFPVASKGDTALQFSNISFTYTAAAAKDLGDPVYASTVSDYPGVANTPVGADPQHTQIRFGSVTPLIPNGFPLIRVYRTDAISKIDDASKKGIDALKALLKAQSDLTQVQSINVFRSNTPQELHARNAYLKFKDGLGVRFIAHYSFAVDPIVDGLVYTFVGLATGDQGYIVVTVPLTTTILKDNDPGAALTGANFDIPGYLKQTAATIEAANVTDFAPNLDNLDALIKSINLDVR